MILHGSPAHQKDPRSLRIYEQFKSITEHEFFGIMRSSIMTIRPMYSLFLCVLSLVFSSALHAQLHIGSGQSYSNIQAAAEAGDIHPGDTVYLHEGSYAGYQAIVKLHGSADQWIHIRPFAQDSVAISGGWQFISCSYLRFEKLKFTGTTQYPGRTLSVDNGGSCTTQSHHIVIDSCVISNTTDSSAIAACKFGGVDDFEVTNSVFRNIPNCEALGCNSCHNGVIRNNRFENVRSAGHIKGGGRNISIEANFFISASRAPMVAFELGGDTSIQFYCAGDSTEVENLRFVSNFLIGGYRGVSLSSAVNCLVQNNTIVTFQQMAFRLLTTSSHFPRCRGNRIRNNLFVFADANYMNGSQQSADAANFDHNLYYSLVNSAFTGPYWDKELDSVREVNPLIYATPVPMLEQHATYDAHLAKGSPAIGRGAALSEALNDFYGRPFRQQNPSIGAAEYYEESPSKVESDDAGSAISVQRNGQHIEVRIAHSNAEEVQDVQLISLIGNDCSAALSTLAQNNSDKLFLLDSSRLASGVYFVSARVGARYVFRRIDIAH